MYDNDEKKKSKNRKGTFIVAKLEDAFFKNGASFIQLCFWETLVGLNRFLLNSRIYKTYVNK